MRSAEATFGHSEVLSHFDLGITIRSELNVLKTIYLGVEACDARIKLRSRENVTATGAEHAIQPTVKL
jgi:hypothetical protein